MDPTSRADWRLNWWLIAAGSVSMLVTTLPSAVIGVFIEPLEAEFGWSRTAITSAAAMTMIVAAFFSPVLGLAIERYGARWIGLIGMALTPLLFAAVSLVNHHLWVYLGLWLLISFTVTLGGGQPWTTAVSRAFTGNRGLALGLTIAGGSLAGAISPPVAAYLVVEHGWRSAHAILGLGTFAIFAPLTYLLVRGRARPLPVAVTPATRDEPDQAPEGITLGAALRLRSFWQLQAGLILGCMMVNGIAVHFIPMLTSRALSTVAAASAMTALGVGAFTGKFLVGWLMDRVHPPRVVAATRLAGAAAAFLLLASDHQIGLGLAYFLAFVAGIAVGGEIPITAFLSARQFGMAHFSRLYAWTFAGNRVASGLGPMALALLYDLRGDYRFALGLAGGLLCASAVLIALLDPVGHSSRDT